MAARSIHMNLQPSTRGFLSFNPPTYHYCSLGVHVHWSPLQYLVLHLPIDRGITRLRLTPTGEFEAISTIRFLCQRIRVDSVWSRTRASARAADPDANPLKDLSTFRLSFDYLMRLPLSLLTVLGRISFSARREGP
jgi:hypothetical protein